MRDPVSAVARSLRGVGCNPARWRRPFTQPLASSDGRPVWKMGEGSVGGGWKGGDKLDSLRDKALCFDHAVAYKKPYCVRAPSSFSAGDLEVMQKRPRVAHVLIDWNSELRGVRSANGGEGVEVARRALKQVSRRVGRLLNDQGGGQSFFLFFRVYHGWRIGFKPTPHRLALEAARVYNPSNPDDRGLSEYSPAPNQIVRDLEFGDLLLGANNRRLCGPFRDHHLPSTLQQDRSGYAGEKMVDTALVSDLIHLAVEDDGSWLVVVGQDADLVPGILTAEGLLQGTDRRVMFLARGGFRNSNPTIMDLVCRR